MAYEAPYVSTLERLWAVYWDAIPGAFLISALIALAMIFERQPARRRILARGGLCALLAVIPIVALVPLPRYNVFHLVGELLPIAWCRRIPGAVSLDSSTFHTNFPFDQHPSIFSFYRIAEIVVAIGCGISVSLVLLGIPVSAWLLRRSTRPSAETISIYEKIPFPNRVRRPDLLVCPHVNRPLLIGPCENAILIPPRLDDPAASEQLELSLLHESAHAEDGDPSFRFIAGLSRAIWFFSPFVWWIHGRLMLDQEFLADRKASNRYGTGRRYAERLVDLAVEMPTAESTDLADRDRREPAAEPNANADHSAGSSLYQRLLFLLRCPFAIEARPPLAWTIVVVSLLAIGTLASASLSLNPDFAQARTARPYPRRFIHIHTLTLSRPDPAQGLCRDSCEIPVQLPAGSFVLNMRIWGTWNDLHEMKIAGVALRETPEIVADSSMSKPKWHNVSLIKRHDRIVLRFDGVLMGRSRSQENQTLQWITLNHAPRPSVRIQDLTLRW
jgi:beta-lactamase regulating signal transducer with metallopeptidase domain